MPAGTGDEEGLLTNADPSLLVYITPIVQHGSTSTAVGSIPLNLAQEIASDGNVYRPVTAFGQCLVTLAVGDVIHLGLWFQSSIVAPAPIPTLYMENDVFFDAFNNNCVGGTLSIIKIN
jgi:hypothetical protein